MKKSIDEISKLIIKWAEERNIFEESNPQKQFDKLTEEKNELAEGILKDDLYEILDAIGDCFVVLCNLAHFYHLDIRECINHAWNEIKDRKGKMIDGKFVKEEDLEGIDEKM